MHIWLNYVWTGCKGSGEAVWMSSLVWDFIVRRCNKTPARLTRLRCTRSYNFKNRQNKDFIFLKPFSLLTQPIMRLWNCITKDKEHCYKVKFINSTELKYCGKRINFSQRRISPFLHKDNNRSFLQIRQDAFSSGKGLLL